jgi:tetratricopeptide (TPR) repeat protein
MYNLSLAFGYDVARQVLLRLNDLCRPQILLLHPPYDVADTGLYGELRQSGIIIYGARLDDFYLYGFRPDHLGLLSARGRCSVTTTVCRRSLEFMRRHGLPNVFHQKYRMNVESRSHPPIEKDIDVSFIGGAQGAHRVECIRALLEAGIDVRVWGHWWDKHADLAGCHFGFCSHEEKIAIFHRSKIHLCLHQGREDRLTPAPIHARVMESLLAGALPIYGEHPDVVDFFQPGEEIVLYSSPADLLAKVQHYLAHADERERIVQAGRERTLREHTVAQWWRDSEEILGRAKLSPAERRTLSEPVDVGGTTRDPLLVFVHALMAELYADLNMPAVSAAYATQAARFGDPDLPRAIARRLIATSASREPQWQPIADSLRILLDRMGSPGEGTGEVLSAAAVAGGHIAEKARNWAGAIDLYRRAIELSGDSISAAWSGVGRCAVELGLRTRAIECFRKADARGWDMGSFRNWGGYRDLDLPGLGTSGLGSVDPQYGPKTHLLMLYLAEGDWDGFFDVAASLLASNVTQFGGVDQVLQVLIADQVLPLLWQAGEHEALDRLGRKLIDVVIDDEIRSRLAEIIERNRTRMRGELRSA